MTTLPRAAWAAVAAGAALRLAFVLVHPPTSDLGSDMATYWTTAEALLGRLEATPAHAFYPVGTAVLIAGVLAVFGDAAALALGGLWWALSSAVPLLWLLWATPRMSLRAALLSTWLVALWPIHATWPGWLLSEVPAELGLLLTLVLVDRIASSRGVATAVAVAVAAGVSAGVSLALRPQLALHMIAVGLAPLRAAPRRALLAVACALPPVLLAGALVASLAGESRFPALSLSKNAGFNFFYGHCDVRFARAAGQVIGSPVAVQNDRGSDIIVDDHAVTDQGFWFSFGLDCIASDGVAHAGQLAQHVVDLGATSSPWPQMRLAWLRPLVDAANLALTCLLPVVLVFGLARPRGRPLAVQILLLIPQALLFHGDPRYRAMTDVFALGLIAMLVDEIATRLVASRGGRPAQEQPDA